MAGEALELTRTINAPRDMVFQAWLDPEKMKQWWGPEGFSCPVFKNEPKVGGKYFASMKEGDGPEGYVCGVYKTIQPSERLVMSDCFSDDKGNIVSADKVGMPGKWPLECLIDLTFSEDGKKTTMKLHHEGIPDEMLEDCRQGWSSSFNKLERLFQN